MIFAAVPMVVSMLLMQSTIFVRRKLALWNRLCKKLGVKDKVLHEIVGTSFIPWVREQPFDYDQRNATTSEDESEMAKEHKVENTA